MLQISFPPHILFLRLIPLASCFFGKTPLGQASRALGLSTIRLLLLYFPMPPHRIRFIFHTRAPITTNPFILNSPNSRPHRPFQSPTESRPTQNLKHIPPTPRQQRNQTEPTRKGRRIQPYTHEKARQQQHWLDTQYKIQRPARLMRSLHLLVDGDRSFVFQERERVGIIPGAFIVRCTWYLAPNL